MADFIPVFWFTDKWSCTVLQYTALKIFDDDKDFDTWAWNLLFRLKLHNLDLKQPQWIQIYDGFIEILDLPNPFEDSWLQPLLNAYESRHPVACYLMLIMTTIGHRVDSLMKDGLTCLMCLIEKKHYLAAIHSMYYVLPFFVKKSDEMLKQTEFISSLGMLMIVDVPISMKLTDEVVLGAILHKVAAMIKYQIEQAGLLSIEIAVPLLKLWIKLLLKILTNPSMNSHLKYQTKQIHYLLDVVIRIAFIDSFSRENTMDLLYSLANPLLMPNSSANLSIWKKYFGKNDNFYTLLQKETIPDFPWLAYSVILNETKQKNLQELWWMVQKEMFSDDKITPFNALKKSASFLKISNPSLEQLPLYRWGKQIIKTPVSHQSLPLMWQQFFLCYFRRQSLESQVHCCIGPHFFLRGNSIALLNKLKECLKASEECWFTKLQKTRIPTEIQNMELEISRKKQVCKQDESISKERDQAFKLYKIFRSFSLWISDAKLPLPNICFTALDPKYCPEKLKLIFDNDEEKWYDLVSFDSIREELATKQHPWISRTSSYSTTKEIELSSEKFEERVSRHLKINKEKTLQCEFDLKPHTQDIEDAAFSSKNTLIHFIETNQNIIYEKAKLFKTLSEKLRQLNFDYENLIPQEYDIFSSKVEIKKECYKGMKCACPENFKLNIQGYTLNQRIREKLDRNQIDHHIVQEQLLNFPMLQLCSAAVLIENYIKILSNKMKTSDISEVEKIKEMGERLFYHELEEIDRILPMVSCFSPSRQFFSTSIEALGKKFISGQENQLLPLAKAIVKLKNAGRLASNLILPNTITVSILPDLYNTITYAVKHNDASTAFVLLSKIDLPLILNDKIPDLTTRKNIFECICSALHACGFKHEESILPFYAVLKKEHFSTLLLWRFPELFCDATKFCIEGMESEQISADVFYEMICCIGCFKLNEQSSLSDIGKVLKKFSHNMLLPPDQLMYVTSNQINMHLVIDTLKFLCERYMKKRLHQNIYETYKSYIKPYGLFIALLSHTLPLMIKENISKNMTSISDVWNLLNGSFFPWIHPTQQAMHLNFPWCDKHIEYARYMFQMFTTSLNNLYEIISELNGNNQENGENILSCCWTHYVDVYVKPGLRHYSVSLCHTEYMTLPWEKYHPDSNDIEAMCTVLQSDLYENKEFLSKVSIKIPWLALIKTVMLTNSDEYVRRILSTLGKLLIISGLDVSLTQSNAHLNKVKILEDLPWSILNLEEVQSLILLYYKSYNPSITIEEEQQKNPDFYIFQFLKIVCGMTISYHGIDLDLLQSKQLVFLHQYNLCLSQDIVIKESSLRKSSNLQKLIPGLLSEVEIIIRKNVKVNQQMARALPLVREILCFLNDIPEPHLEELSVQSIIVWLKCHYDSPLLLPCLQIASQCLNQVKSAVAIVECCIQTRFTSGVSHSADAKCIWDKLLSSFQLQAMSRTEFIQHCVNSNSFLTLYCHVLELLPKSSTPENKKMLLFSIVDWIKTTDLKDVRESDEGKCLLLWDKVLELCIMLAQEDEHQAVHATLVAFCNKLTLLGEDKSSMGIFGALGFGSSSNLSVNFRFLCRLTSSFVSHQLPENAGIRLEPMAAGYKRNDIAKKPSYNEPWPNPHALHSLESLQSLLKNKSYSALKELVNGAIEFVINPEYCLLNSRKLLKNYSLLVFPKQSYLFALDC